MIEHRCWYEAMVLARPQKKKRTGFLARLGEVMRRSLHIPVARMVKEVVNPAYKAG